MAEIHTKQEIDENSLTKDQESKVRSYIEEKYKTYNSDEVIIFSTKSGIFIKENKDSSPLVLNRNIIS